MAARARKFEDELRYLEAIVTRIDSGELTLEESIEAFERGIALVKTLNRKLDEAQQKIEILTRDSGGELRTAAFEANPKGRGGGKDDDETPF
ncbi:MAG TPA: exodeoxyribonuclease VII small subunit [Candidatus Binataceae bacterium]|nr:exodeoxyribonuclease VII small subunit [Candidatus Binataceae bacterium]